tara:strand:- start:629 stop:868 length:240 start_codon:yes stop_codon:yes gene_type:complete
MIYYILLPEDTSDDAVYSTNILGESSFKNFWGDQGLEILKRLINKYPDTLDVVRIKDEKSKEYSIEEFFDIISKLNIIQ